MPRRIAAENRIIPTVRKHIVPQEALAGGSVAVSVDKSAEGGVVISALEVIEARFSDCGLSLRAIWAGFLLGKMAIPGGQNTLPESTMTLL